MKKIISIVLSLCLGLVFILSAYSKLFPIEPFEYNIVGTTFIGWKLSVFAARLIIAIEFLLGVLFLFSYNHKKTVPVALGLMAVFSIHLLYQLISKGNDSDCGCFGTMFSMTPLLGLLKNIVIMAVLWILMRLGFQYKFKLKHLEFYLFLIAATTIFIVNPVDLGYAENYLNKPFENFPLEFDTVYNSDKNETIQKPVKDVRKGKYLVAFLSSTCGHCKIAAGKLSVINSENPRIPMYFFINGEVNKIETFRKNTSIRKIPWSKLNGSVFIELAGLQLPVIYYLNNSVVEQQVDYYSLEQAHIEQWLAK